MTQDYRVHVPGGVTIEATGQIIYPGDPEWPIYEAWLAEQPGPSAPGGPVPPGTGLLPFIVVVPTLAESRAEMLARLDALIQLRRGLATVNAAGHAWRLTDSFLHVLSIHAVVFPPVPAGFTLPNSARVQVALSLAQFRQVLEAVSNRLVAVNAFHAALVTAINASPAPLTVDIEAGWP